MLTRQRQQHLLAALKRDGRLVAKDLSAELAVSEDTIRRDLRELAAQGLLQRVHGGALPVSAALADFAARQSVVPGDKAAIGRAAARLVKPGQVVFIDGGTTAVQLARALAPDLRATVVTHSPSIAIELVAHPGVEVVMIGGRLFKHSVVNVGSVAMEGIARVHADTFFLGVTGVDVRAGLSTGDAEEAGIKRALMAASAETVVLASSEKLGVASPHVVAPLAEASTLVVPAAAPKAMVAAWRKLGLDVVLAGGA